MRIFRTTTILILPVLLSGSLASAQLVPDPVSLSSSPTSPTPGQDFTVTASTPTFDRNTAVFSWIVDGRARPDLSGQGKNKISLKAGKIGSVTRVGLNVSTPQGQDGSAQVSVRVSDLTLTWFAETYTPKWYKGKALAIPDSVVNIVAHPEIVIGGRTFAPESLIYSWDFADQEKALSGVGEQVFRIKTSLFPRDTHHIKVRVEDAQKQISQEKEIFLLSTKPKVVIYPSSPLGGPEVRSAPSVSIAPQEDTRDFVAEPFYLPVVSKQNLTYDWNVSGSKLKGNTGREFSLSLNIGSLPFQVNPITVTVPTASSILTSVSAFLNLFVQ